MPPQQASRVCRTLGRQAQSQPESVWVSEGTIGNAFDRYWRVSLAARRMASSVPGPMENRRRLGKRTMTELGVQAHPPMPPWALSMAPDLTQWQWKPPTQRLSAPRNQQARSSGPWSFSVELPAWLDNWRSENVGALEDGVKTEYISTEKSITAPFFAELDALANLPGNFPESISIRLELVGGQLQQLLALGALTKDEVSSVCDSLLATVRDKLRLSHPKLMEDHSIRLCAAILSGISACKILPRDYYGELFWKRLLLHMTELPANDQLGQVFEQFMLTVPQRLLRTMRQGLVPIVQNLVKHGSQAITTAEETELGQQGLENSELTGGTVLKGAQSLARALDGLDRVQQARFRQAFTRVLLSQLTSMSDAHRQQVHHWLFVLAHMVNVEQAYLFGVLKEYRTLHRRQLMPTTELCALLIAQWGSRGYADSSATMGAFKAINRANEETAPAALALSVYKHHNQRDRRGLHYSLWKFVRKLELDGEFLSSLRALSRRRMLPLPFLEHLAWTSHDPRATAAIQSLYNREVRRNRPSMPMWHPRFWNRRGAGTSLAMDVSLTAAEVFEALDLWEYSGRTMAKGRNDRRRWCKVGPQTEKLVIKLAVRFAYASDLSSREALRRISQCRRFLLDHGCSIPPAVTRALFRILTQVFTDSQLGSRVRFRWFLGIVKKQLGLAAALDCARALDRGREGARRLQQETKQG